MKQAQGPRYPVLRDLCLMASIATRAYFHDRTPSVCTLLGLATWMTVPVVGRLMASQLPQGAQIFRLLPEHVGVAAAVTLLCTIAAASYGGMRAAAIPPADGLRDE